MSTSTTETLRRACTPDVYLSYAELDRTAVDRIAELLRSRGYTVYDPWKDEGPLATSAAEALSQSRCAALFLGAASVTDAQRREHDLALEVHLRRKHDFGVLPILLPGATPGLNFLNVYNWAVIRDDSQQAQGVEMLVCAIEGREPGEELRARSDRARAETNPYRGLEPFREGDAEFFFGREELVEEVVRQVQESSVVSILGPSGSGKSSLVLAGVVPALNRLGWSTRTLVPGSLAWRKLLDSPEEPLLPATAKHLLFVDQAEQLYAEDVSPEERASFLARLEQALAKGYGRVILTMRATFLDELMRDGRLVGQPGRELIWIPPMTDAELRRCITEPARAVGGQVESALADILVESVSGQPSKLALLEFALTEMWLRQTDMRLTLSEFQEIGRLEQLLHAHAERTFQDLPDVDREGARRIFLSLVSTAGSSPVGRRIAEVDVPEAARGVLGKLVEARLLVVGRAENESTGTVTLAHEALLAHWERARRWIRKSSSFLLWHDRFLSSYRRWMQSSRRSDLLQGAPLADARRWAKDSADLLTAPERAYVQRSADHARRRRWAWGSLVVVTLVTAAAFLLQTMRQTALRAVRIEMRSAEYVLAQAEGVGDPWLASQLLQELTEEVEPSNGTARAAALLRDPVPERVLRGHGERVTYISFSEDGEHVLSASADGTVREWSATASGKERVVDHCVAVWAAQLHPDGARLLTLADDNAVRVWRFGTTEPEIVLQHPDLIYTATFSPDGTRVLTACADGAARLWELDSAVPLVELPHDGPVTLAAFGSAGARIGSIANGHAQIWTLSESQGESGWTVKAVGPNRALQMRALGVSGPTSAMQLGEERVVTGTVDGTVIEQLDSNPLMSRKARTGTFVYCLALLPSGNVLAGGADGHLTLVDFRSGLSHSLLTEASDVLELEVDRRGRLFAALTEDGVVGLRQLPSGEPLASIRQRDRIWVVSISPDGARVATGSENGEVRIWSVPDMERAQAEPPSDWGAALRRHRARVSVPLSPADRARWLGQATAMAP